MKSLFHKASVRLGLVTLILFLAVAAFVFTPSIQIKAAAVDQLVGYGAGTTGGAGGSTVTVNSLSALTSAVSGSTPKIVNISGTISGAGDVKVGSNTTILGVGSTGSLVGIGLVLDGVSNVIIRNLNISFVQASSGNGDAIHIVNGTTRVWVDHNNLFSDRDHGTDFYDGLIDITHASDNITVSWNRIHDHVKTSLIGHSDSNGAEDTGHLHVTYHHNWFFNVTERLPSLRFGTGHVYNNYFQNVSNSAVHSRMGAQMLVQNNVFRNVDEAITTTGDSSQDGFVNASGNDFGGATVTITQVGSFTQAPYSFTLDDTSTVIDSVTANSGVGIINGGGGSTPVPTPTPTRTPGVTPTPTRTPTPAPTSTSGTGCRVTYTITNQWPGGFSATFVITNTGTTTINGWNLAFTFANGQTITQLWNGSFTQSGGNVTITNVSYNAALDPGTSLASEPGFNGTQNGTNAVPTAFTLNGTRCS